MENTAKSSLKSSIKRPSQIPLPRSVFLWYPGADGASSVKGGREGKVNERRICISPCGSVKTEGRTPSQSRWTWLPGKLGVSLLSTSGSFSRKTAQEGCRAGPFSPF